MFIRLFSLIFAPEGEAGAGGGSGPPAVKPEDARTYLADFVADPDGLKTMDDAKVVELHTRVTGSIKKHQETAAKTEFEKRARPEHVPEQFWDPDKREIKVEAMSKSWNDFRQASKGQAPKTPEEYAFTPPEGMTLDKDDKLLPEFRKVAHAAGLSNEAFSKIAGEMMKSGILQPALLDPVKEKEKLGPQADAMIAANETWGKKLVESGVWDQQDYNEMMVLGSSAEGIRALNKMREFYGGEKIPTTTSGTGNAAQNVQGWYAKHNAVDPKTGKLRIEVDEQYRREVDAEAAQIFGNQPARSSIPGAGVPG